MPSLLHHAHIAPNAEVWLARQIASDLGTEAVIKQPAVITCGSEHNAAISSRGQLFTWGLAANGQLGNSDCMPTESCIPRPVLTPQGIRIVSVCAGSNHTLAISEVTTTPRAMSHSGAFVTAGACLTNKTNCAARNHSETWRSLRCSTVA